MATPQDGTEARIVRTEEQVPTQDVKDVLQRHEEALVIVVDRDSGSEGESNVAVFSKLLDEHGVLSPLLANILQNLLETQDGKQRGGVPDKTTASA
jgi:hypothetical protein